MKHRLRSLRMPLATDNGYALPFALLVLVITGLLLSTGFLVAEALQARVQMRIEVLHARDLVHAGVNTELSLLLKGKNESTLHYQNNEGFCDVESNKTSVSSRFYTITASATTFQGAKSTATVIFDPLMQRVSFWNESP